MTAVKSLSPPTLRRLRFEVTSYTFYTWESNLDTATISGASSKQPVLYRFFSFYPIFGDFLVSASQTFVLHKNSTRWRYRASPVIVVVSLSP